MKRIAVLGSINMDMTVIADRIPGPGETLSGRDLRTVPGGKGANQAVAAARLGAEVTMFGCVGQDAFGERLVENLQREGVETRWIRRIADAPTGLAMITVAQGENAIVVIPGANDCVTPEYLDSVGDALLECDILLMQNEIPAETVRRAAAMARAAGRTVIWNPAPARPADAALIAAADYLTPNEHEVCALFPSMGAGKEALRGALESHPGQLIVTLGSRGAAACDAAGPFIVPAIRARAVDTTGAGDTFNGAFACALARSMDFRGALKLAGTAAGLSVEKPGAQGGMPDLGAVMERMD